MQMLPLSTLLTGVTLSFACGATTAWFFHATDQSSDQMAGTAPVAIRQSASQPAGMHQFAAIWSQTGTTDSATETTSPAPQALIKPPAATEEQKLLELAQSGPAALTKLIQRYGTENNPHTKDVLKSVLASVQKPEVFALSAHLATSTDAARRREGFELLQHAATEPAGVRNMVKQALAHEQSAEVLVQALAALKPAVVEPAESGAIVSQLDGLTQHADPTVRSQSVLQLAQWDNTGTAVARVSQALADPALEVRAAAVSALAQSGMRSDQVKAALLSMINNANENRDLKDSALQALERFALNREEYAHYVQARSRTGL